MKITFVLDTFGGGGKERRCLQLIQGLNKKGFNDIQVIIVNNDIAYEELYQADVDLYIIDRKNKGLGFFRTLKTLNGLIRQFNPDIVQVWGVFSAIFTNVIRCFTPFKYIGSYVANCNKPDRLSITQFVVLTNVWLSDCIIGNSRAGINAYGIPKRKSKIIYNGFNEERYFTSDDSRIIKTREEIGGKANFIVSMIARLDDNKDHETFIEAAKLIIEKRSDILFIIVGRGDNFSKLEALPSSVEKENIKFLGFRSDVENILKITDISVLCTNPERHKEGVSNAIMESLAFGVPVVATNDGGTPEIVKDGYNGFLIDSNNKVQLSEKILNIIDNEVLKNELSVAAKRTILDGFTLSKMTEEYIQLYNTYLNK